MSFEKLHRILICLDFFFGSVLAKSCRVCVMWFRPRALLFSFFSWDSLYIFSAFDEIFMSRGQMFMINCNCHICNSCSDRASSFFFSDW